MNFFKTPVAYAVYIATTVFVAGIAAPAQADSPPVAQTPLNIGAASEPPLNMLVMGRDHKLYYEAYNDASDLNGDGILDVGYKGHLPSNGGGIDYYGYFDSHRCYTYAGGKFTPAAAAPGKTCSGAWSGDYLNYLTTSRMDALRKVLYGGYRIVDTSSVTTLERAYIPQDAHSWGSEYTSLAVDGYDISRYTPFSPPAAGKRILFTNVTLLGQEARGPLLRVRQNTRWRKWDWSTRRSPVSSDWCGSTINTLCNDDGSALQDFVVRVDVCVAGALEDNCKQYPNGQYKPTGILHDYGEANRMMFGLITGSYNKNTQGGVLRKNLENFNDEVDPNTGQLTSVVGIVKTIDRFRPVNLIFDGSSPKIVENSCSTPPQSGVGNWIKDRPIGDGECPMWGNPIAEMMYEALRHFGGAAGGRPEYTTTGGIDANLQLPSPAWKKPYEPTSSGGQGYLRCATPVMTVISDINPSYDGAVPGSNWGALSASGDPAPVDTLDAGAEVDAIWAAEGGGSRQIFIGESGGVYDSAPTAKTVTGLRTVRGLSPEEPTKQGTYYSAAIAHFGANNNIGGDKKVMTYSVALASPLPTLRFPIGGQVISVVPFAKTVYGNWGGVLLPTGPFQPTNQIVDFYVTQIANTDPAGSDADPSVNGGRPYARFSINFEDVEQGADHDMDAIVEYEFKTTASGELEVTLESTYASGSFVQYIGYVISGTTKDGVYLEVSDCDTTVAGSNYSSSAHCGTGFQYQTPQRYHLNTPPGQDPGFCANPANLASQACLALPYKTTRKFTPGSGSGAELLKGPLWYAAKYGRPSTVPWDVDGNGDPDNYFLVTNAGTLKEQLDRAFSQIIADTQSSGGVAASGARITEGFMAYVPSYNTSDWTGDLKAHKLDPSTGGLLPETWSASALLAQIADADIPNQGTPNGGRNLFYIDPSASAGSRHKPFTVTGMGGPVAAEALLNTAAITGISGVTIDDWVNYLRGDHSKEIAQGGPFRSRSSRLGDLFTEPVALNKASYGYRNLPAPEGSTYEVYMQTKDSRVPVVFQAANDGFLHAFDATDGVNGGKELFAVAPNAVLGHMAKLGDPGYMHRYYVGGTPTQGDAFINGAWKTVLLGTTGAGGRSIYALDVTNPAASNGWSVLWEFTDVDLGLTIGAPKIARLPSGQWAAVFSGTGYDTPNDNAHLYVVNLETGALIHKVKVSNDGTQAKPNGLGTPSVVDLQGDGITDLIYAGDYYGKLWKFTLPTGSGGNVAVQHLFTATDSLNGQPQPITGGVTVSVHPVRGEMVFFGTGRYFLEGDNAAPTGSDQIQSFYGIWDDNGAFVNRGQLVRQYFVEGASGRTTTDNPVDWGSNKGWYIDLQAYAPPTPGSGSTGGVGAARPANGERFISLPTVSLGRVFFQTYALNGDECEPGGVNWINSLWATSGTGALGGPDQASRPIGGSNAPITGAPNIVVDVVGGDQGNENCDPNDPNCQDPAPGADMDGDGVPDDLGIVPSRGCILTVSLLVAGGKNPLLRMGCGRQAWRQIE